MKKFLTAARRAVGLVALALPLLARPADLPPTQQELLAKYRAIEVQIADLGKFVNTVEQTPSGALVISCNGCTGTTPPIPSGGPPRPSAFTERDLDMGMRALTALRQNDAAGQETAIVTVGAQRAAIEKSQLPSIAH